MIFLIACGAEAPQNPMLTIHRTPDAAVVDGAVAEVLSAGGYRYLRLGDDWHVVMTRSAFTAGQVVQLKPMGEAADFYSRGLGRRFERLQFSYRVD